MKKTKPRILIILDACRFDYFSLLHEALEWPGELIETWNQYRDTADWYRHIIAHQDNRDCILVVSSPIFGRRWMEPIAGAFKKLITTFDKDSVDHFARPEPTLEAAEKALILQPRSRLLIHLVPPHLPFMGEKGNAFLREHYKIPDGKPLGTHPNIYHDIQTYATKKGAWREIQEYYKENIEVGMNAILEASWLEGKKVIVTSDHGELIGEKNLFRHYSTTLPWLVLP